jgi:hypothetical protein
MEDKESERIKRRREKEKMRPLNKKQHFPLCGCICRYYYSKRQ